MSSTEKHGNNLAAFIWSIADQLRGPYKPNQYGHVVLPLTILRRLDAILEPTKDEVLALAEKAPKPEHLEIQVRHRLKLPFHNTSRFTFRTLLGDPSSLRENLIDYMNSFSSNVADIFERFKFAEQIATLDEKDRLFIVIQRFAEVDLHPDTISNADMGLIFEELIRRFAESSNEEAGEHFTPRDAVRLLADLLLAADDESLSEPGIVRTFYDPTAGTGGMLSIAEEHLLDQNPDARIALYGQELNDFSYAICKADLIAKGQSVDNIRLGDTIREDHFADETFDFCLSNPPYGVDWSAARSEVEAEAARLGEDSRFGHGLPAVSDGQMLFLTHLVYKLRKPQDGGGRAGIFMDGSPLFNGAAGSGPSEIRRWLFESDLVDAIVALPEQMFYNTGIGTYIWLIDNDKAPERRGKVQLIDARQMWEPMRKGLGDKRRYITDEQRTDIVALYDAYEDADPDLSKVLPYESFGYQRITVERPMRRRYEVTPEGIEAVLATKSILKLSGEDQGALREAMKATEGVFMAQPKFLDEFEQHARTRGLKVTAPIRNAVLKETGTQDAEAEVITDRRGEPQPDTKLRDNEDVPLGDDIDEFFKREVLPHVPDAWVDHAKTRVGYEIPFNRIFYKYEPPRSLEEIDTDLNRLVGEIMEMLQEIEQ